MSLTEINNDELLPHLKNFIDDIVSMATGVVLKRSDIANSYEDSSSAILSEYYEQIIQGTDTLNMYQNIPYEVLSSLLSWKVADIQYINSFPSYIEYGKTKVPMKNKINTCYIGTDIPTDKKFKDFGEKYDGYLYKKSEKFNIIDFLYYNNESDIWFKLVSYNSDISPDKLEKEILNKIYIRSDEEIANNSPVPDGKVAFDKLYVRLNNGEYKSVFDIPNRYSHNDGEYYVDKYGIYEYVLDYDAYIKISTFNIYQISNIINNNYKIPSNYQDEVLQAMRDYVINTYVSPDLSPSKDFDTPRYFGERNAYYRQLNGLPPYSKMDTQPNIIMNSILPDEYPDPSITKKLYNLTDDEIDAIKLNGKYDELFNKYSSIKYLKYMGRNRIDVISARKASNFDMIKIGKYNEEYHYNIFMENFHIAKEYILRKFYHPELFSSQEYYGSFISYLILCQAMCQSVAHSDSILLNNLYTDENSIRLRLQSYGLNVFDDIPLVYRKRIAKNIENLIRNKGIDSIYSLILDIFNVDDIEVYKYFYRKLKTSNGYSLSMSQIPINTEKFISEITKNINRVEYDEITKNDIYWGSYGMQSTYKDAEGNIKKMDPDIYLKEKIMEIPFNYMNSKYISINAIFNLSKLNFNSSYLMNYLLELSKRNLDITIGVDGINEKQSLFMIMVFLFAIQAKRLKYDGNIQHDAVSVAYVLKYNLDQEIFKDGKVISIYELYKQYSDIYYKYLIETKSKKSIKELIDEGNKYETNEIEKYKILVDNMSDDEKDDLVSLKIPTDISISSISDTYLFNSGLDGAYDNLIKLRENASSYREYECYNELLKAISISKLNNTIFKISQPIWIEIDNFVSWNEVTDISIKEMVYNDFINKSKTSYLLCRSDGYPDLSLGESYSETKTQYCIDTSTITNTFNESIKVYIKDKIVYSNITNDRKVGNNSILYVIRSESIDDLNNKLNSIDLSTYIDPYCYDKRDGKIYKYLRYARTYQEYLYYENRYLYNILQPTDDEYTTDSDGNKVINSEYYDRLSELYTNIVIAIENLVKDDNLKNIINSSFTDLNLLTTYIKKVVSVFKSFEIDIATINIIYEINDPNKHRIKTIDEISSESNESHFDHMHFIHNIDYEEESYHYDTINIRDELDMTIINESEVKS